MSASRKLIAKFKEAALRFGECSEIGDHTGANDASGRADLLKRKIVSESTVGVAELTNLLADDNAWVRYAAAASSLDIEPERAYQVLVKLQAQDQAVGAAAYAALRMWEAGAPRA